MKVHAIKNGWTGKVSRLQSGLDNSM